MNNYATNPVDDPSLPNNDNSIFYEDYEKWARLERNIEAPKIRVSIDNGDERRLVAVEEIHPNERIMFIPSSSLISQSSLNVISEEEFDIIRNSVDDHEYEIRRAEYDSMVDISKIIRMVEGSDEWGEWRSDDTIALFLIAGRKIIEDYGLPNVLSLNELIPSAETMLLSPDTSQPEDIDLAVCLDAEVVTNPVASNSSSFLHHISMLPKSFPSMPLYFEPDELSRLEGTNCHGYTTRMQFQLQSDWERLRSILQAYDSNWILTMEYFTEKMYKWAMSNIFSRSTDFFVEVLLDQEELCPNSNDNTITKVLRVIAPVFDFMNHNFQSQVYHSMDASGNISVFNGPDVIQANEEVCLNYGNFPNEKLLLVYGFTVLPNPFDSVQLYAPIPPSDLLFAMKTNILLNQFQINHSEPDLLTLKSSLPSNLLTKLRITGVKEEMELLHLVSEHLGNQDDETPNKFPFISVENERNGLKALEYALYNMSRQIALNLINDDNLNAGALSPPSSANVEEEEQLDVKEGAKCLKQKGINHNNAKALCTVEYQILIDALNEVREYLSRLDLD